MIGLLDTSILTANVLSPLLGIENIRTSDNIAFVAGTKGMEELQKQVDSGKFACAFALYPVVLTDLLEISHMGKIMPPKSTWFEPKPRSGFVVRCFF